MLICFKSKNMDSQYGILVGCDKNQEWLLSWWWKNYTQENALPVAFADFGMSEEARQWCKTRGQLLPVDFDGLRVARKDEIEPSLLLQWEKALSPFWGSRQAWFKKPFALLNTPFRKTVWIDLDCEVLGPLEPVFGYVNPKTKLGIVQIGEVYNSGVIVFEKGSPLLKLWAESALSENHRFLSDQDALTDIIFQRGYEVGELPEIYNWIMCRGVHMGAVVCHWAAEWGKAYIRKHGGLRDGASRLIRLPHK
jgi:hypothetical protein